MAHHGTRPVMLARVTAIGQHLAGRGSETPVAYALSPGSLFGPASSAVSRLIDLHPELAGRLILALPQQSWRSLDAEQPARSPPCASGSGSRSTGSRSRASTPRRSPPAARATPRSASTCC